MKFSSMLCALALVSGLTINSAAQEPQAKLDPYRTHRRLQFEPQRDDQIVRKAAEDHVFGIEVDNDIPGRYESFLDPTAKFKVIRTVSEQAHKANNKALRVHRWHGMHHCQC